MVKGHRPDAPSLPRVPVVLGDHHPTEDPCSARQVIEFYLEASAAVGEAIHVVPMGDSFSFVAAKGRVGTLPTLDLPGLADCIADGWAFEGSIATVDGSGGATAIVWGVPTR